MRAAPVKTRTSAVVAEEVRAWMGRRRITGAELSRQLGISQPQISGRVRGDIAWSLDELDTLAGIFDCEVRDLLPRRLPRRDSNLEPSGSRTFFRPIRTDYSLAA